MGAMESEHYAATRAALAADPIIRSMARELLREGVEVSALTFADSGEPTWEFISGASDEYVNRGGAISTHIGGPSEAILALMREWF